LVYIDRIELRPIHKGAQYFNSYQEKTKVQDKEGFRGRYPDDMNKSMSIERECVCHA